MLELLQIFHDTRNNVRKLWEMGLLLGFLEFDQVGLLSLFYFSVLLQGCLAGIETISPGETSHHYITSAA